MSTNLNHKKDAVKLRTKTLSDGSESLYLDIYINGRRKYEYLKLYLLPGKTNKKQNNETMAIAEAVKAQRILDIKNGKFGFDNPKGDKITIVDWVEEVKERNTKKNKSENYIKIASCALNHIKEFTKNKPVKLKDVDKKFILKYIEYLREVRVKDRFISAQSVYLYYMTVNVALNVAVVDGIIEKNPCKDLPADDKPKQVPGEREYLTLEEIRQFIDVKCSKSEKIAKDTFLFSCFTGLRFVDIQNLKWKNIIRIDEETYQIQIIQQKTKNNITIPLTDNALMWLPESDNVDKEDLVFPIESYFNIRQKLGRLIKRSAINKRVTFHVGRHTYATLLLYYGADLYTVSKLLGHTNVKTTQIYAKVMDETKRKAVNLIPNI